MRLGIIAAAAASASANPKLGERDATLISERIGLEDMGFVVHVVDPAVDLAEQLDGLLADYEGQIDDVLFFASVLVALVEDGECFVCLDPEQPDVGDALRDVAGALAQRGEGSTLMVLEARVDDAAATSTRMQQVMAAIQRCVDGAGHGSPGTGIELITAVRPAGAHHERIPSRMTAGLLEAIDSRQGPIDARKAYALAIQGTDFGSWPSAVGYTPTDRSMQLRDPSLFPAAPPSSNPLAPPAQAQAAPATVVPATPSTRRLPDVPEGFGPPSPAPPTPVTRPGVPEGLGPPSPAPPTPATRRTGPDEAPAPRGLRTVIGHAPPDAPPTSPAPGFEPPSHTPAAPDAPPATLPGFEAPPPVPAPVPSRPRRSQPRRPAPPSERVDSATVSVSLGKRPARPSDPLPKVVIAATADPRKSDTQRNLPRPPGADGWSPGDWSPGDAAPPTPPGPAETPSALRDTASEGPAAKRTSSRSRTDPRGGTEPQQESFEDISVDDEISVELPAPPGPPPRRATAVGRGNGAAAGAAPPEKPPSEWTVEDHIAAGDAELAQGFVDKAMAEYKKGLGKLGTATTPARAEIYIRMAELMRKRGKVRVAISNFDKALAIVPADPRALAGLVELHAEQQNWRSVASIEQKVFDSLGEADDRRLELLLQSGARWLDQADDRKRAKERLVAARDAFPRRVEPLEQLLRLFEKEKALEHVLDTRRRIAALIDDPRKRARVYFELGEYCLFEAHREEDALAAFELALDSDPMLLEALEVLATALADGQEWGELERVYLKMKNTFVERPGDEAKVVLAELHHKLALLYRDHLEDPALALASLEDELGLYPDKLPAILLGAEVAAEADRPDRQLELLRHASELEPRRVDTYRSIFALGQRRDDPETSLHAAAVLSVLGELGDRERFVLDEHRVEGVAMHLRPMRPEAWAWFRVKDRDASVDRVMRAVAPAVLRARVLQLEQEGKLPPLPAERQDPKTSTISAIRSLSWGCQFLGVPLPAIYIDEASTDALGAPFAKHQVTVVGKGALSGRNMLELAFLVGRHLALRLPEHELVAHMAVSTGGGLDELSACFLAALKIVLGQNPAAGKLVSVVDTLAALLEGMMTEEERAALGDSVRQFTGGEARVDLRRWVASVERCATRAGFVLCGDLGTAVDIVTTEGNSPFSTVQERVDDLLAFAVGAAHKKLRQELGSALASAEELPPLTKRGGSMLV